MHEKRYHRLCSKLHAVGTSSTGTKLCTRHVLHHQSCFSSSLESERLSLHSAIRGVSSILNVLRINACCALLYSVSETT